VLHNVSDVADRELVPEVFVLHSIPFNCKHVHSKNTSNGGVAEDRQFAIDEDPGRQTKSRQIFENLLLTNSPVPTARTVLVCSRTYQNATEDVTLPQFWLLDQTAVGPLPRTSVMLEEVALWRLEVLELSVRCFQLREIWLERTFQRSRHMSHRRKHCAGITHETKMPRHRGFSNK